MQSMYYIGLDVHMQTISYCVKDGSGFWPARSSSCWPSLARIWIFSNRSRFYHSTKVAFLRIEVPPGSPE
jgi:hypothetical protein